MTTDSANNPLDDDMTRSALATPSLPYLPPEIWRMVVWDKKLSQHDIQALRLACRTLSGVAASRRFYRISISKLNTDRKAFLAICHSPHLAIHVHEVEWLEISYDVDLFDRIANNFGIRQSEGCREDDTAALCSYFHDQAKVSFWMTNAPSSHSPVTGGESIETARENAAAEFRDTFMTTIDLLPNLHTFISRPMTSTRIINSDPAYPMTADLFQRFQEYQWPPSPLVTQTNDGLFFFLAPVMERPSSTVTRLRWADEFPGFSYCRSLPATAFKRLESMELCFTPVSAKLEPAIATLRNLCTSAAPTLRHLKLCEEHGVSSRRPDRSTLMVSELAHSPVCNLRSLSLVGTKCTTDDLFGIIQENANSLRHLYLESVIVHVNLIPRLAQLTDLNLKTMTVIEDASNWSVVCGRALVRYVNGDPPRHDCGYHEEGYLDNGACDEVLCEWLEMSDPENPNHQFVTCPLDSEVRGHCDSDSGSDAESEASEDSMNRRQLSAPKWAWRHFIPTDESLPSGIYCFQVSDSDPLGHKTEYWKFTSRSGEMAHGVNPFDWFEDWDPDKGDLEEPTPYCDQLRRFHLRDEYYDAIYFRRIQGSDETSTAWDLIREEDPPAGAFYYDESLDPVVEYDMRDGWNARWRLDLSD